LNRTLIFSAVGAVAIMLLSLCLGRYSLTPAQVINVLAEPLLGLRPEISAIERQIVWDVRLPRILLAFCAGAGLALSGAALQGVFRNPLVDPHIIGVSSGAAFGGTLAILLSLTPPLLLLSTFSFGLLALLLVFAVNASLANKSILSLVLSGIILSGFFSALVSLLQYLADTEEKLPSIVFWLLGSFATANWDKFLLMAIPQLIAVAVLLSMRWRINVLSLGDRDAQSLGVSVVFVRWLILFLCAVIVASQVAVSGNIGWVGLIIPHIARMLVGADHRKLLPLSLVIGGAYMVLVDDIARTMTGSEIPLGIITALLGTPIFAWLLRRTQSRGW
jgi:iron complex transport system permease protein